MSLLGKSFAPAEAEIRYLDGDYEIIKNGTFVRCAVTGQPIQLNDLEYWSVDLQEAYADAQASYTGHERAKA